jgi:phosphoenolpyruvate---glycerone phosphotransferase subunit DhaL
VTEVRELGQAELGDKTLLDALSPASDAFAAAVAEGTDFAGALATMTDAALAGRDATIDMVAKKGRASRLGERSRGTPDAGATSCALILETLADAIMPLLDS